MFSYKHFAGSLPTNAVNAGKILESVFCKLPAYAAYCSAEAAVNAGAAQMKILKHC